MSEEKSFGKKLKELRMLKGLTQRQLAEKVAERLKADDRRGFDFTYLSKIENERMPPPSIQAISQLADVLGADADELIALAGKTPPDLGATLKESPAARAFFRSVRDLNLSDDQWQLLLDKLREDIGK